MLQTDPEEESVRDLLKYSRKVTQTGEGRAAARHLTGRVTVRLDMGPGNKAVPVFELLRSPVKFWYNSCSCTDDCLGHAYHYLGHR